MVTLKKKSRHCSFLREEKKAKEALVIGLSKSYSKQTEVIFHLCFFFIVKNRAKRNFNNLFVRSFLASHFGGYASVRSTLAGFAEKGGICKRAEHPCRLRREEGDMQACEAPLQASPRRGGYASGAEHPCKLRRDGVLPQIAFFRTFFSKKKVHKEKAFAENSRLDDICSSCKSSATPTNANIRALFIFPSSIDFAIGL